jgi:hypothetical protein
MWTVNSITRLKKEYYTDWGKVDSNPIHKAKEDNSILRRY